MNFKLNISPGVGIFILGFIGLVVALAQEGGRVVGKVPLVFFFLFIIIMGMIIEIKMKDKSSETFGEMESDRGFA